jgi:hypothetical protein
VGITHLVLREAAATKLVDEMLARQTVVNDPDRSTSQVPGRETCAFSHREKANARNQDVDTAARRA